jgi:Arc/MetJ-type ribon-helix-helix transcriptional regulator
MLYGRLTAIVPANRHILRATVAASLPSVKAMEQAIASIPVRYVDRMAQQIAIRIPDEHLQALDQAVAAGTFESRAHGVREALWRLLAELREQEIARQYREAYTRQPDDPAIGEAGAKLLAEAFRQEEEKAS